MLLELGVNRRNFSRTALSIDFEAELMRLHTKMSRLVLMTLEEDLQMFPNQQELC
jgi:hypothetical protein